MEEFLVLADGVGRAQFTAEKAKWCGLIQAGSHLLQAARTFDLLPSCAIFSSRSEFLTPLQDLRGSPPMMPFDPDTRALPVPPTYLLILYQYLRQQCAVMSYYYTRSVLEDESYLLAKRKSKRSNQASTAVALFLPGQWCSLYIRSSFCHSCSLRSIPNTNPAGIEFMM